MTIRPQIPRISGIDPKIAAILNPMRQVLLEVQANAVRTSAFRSSSGFRINSNGLVELVEENPIIEAPVENLRETIERRIADLEAVTNDVANVASNLFADGDFGTLIGDLAAQSQTLKVNVNGHIAGYGVAAYAGAAGQVTSDFIVQADRFSVVFPNPPWSASQAYTLGQYVSATEDPGAAVIFECTTAGTTGTTEPTWNTTVGATTNDGTAVWTARSISERVPFVVGNIGGSPGVGINGDLIVDGTIVANAMNVTALSAITANVGTLLVSTAGYIRSGQTAYNTGTGWFLGNNSGTPVFSIGNPAGNYLTWDGSALGVNGALRIANSAQTFNPSWGGFSTEPTGDTVSYLDLGGIVIMWLSATISPGTSNANTMTWPAGTIPSAIRPAATRHAALNVVSGGQGIGGGMNILADGSAVFLVADASGNLVGTNFDSTGSKGITGGSVWIYSK